MAEIPWSKLVPVPERYQGGGCRIEDTAKRGLTLEMLEGLFTLIKDVLDAGYKIVDNISGEEVTIDTINLYHVDEHFVKPLTKKHQCSFVELAATEETVCEPKFFVSHWWGTPLIDTIRMLKLHKDKACTFRESILSNMNEDKYYSVWICAFSNRQHNLDSEDLDSGRFQDTPFARAILSDACLGTVLLFNETNATPLTRSWCILKPSFP